MVVNKVGITYNWKGFILSFCLSHIPVDWKKVDSFTGKVCVSPVMLWMTAITSRSDSSYGHQRKKKEEISVCLTVIKNVSGVKK